MKWRGGTAVLALWIATCLLAPAGVRAFTVDVSVDCSSPHIQVRVEVTDGAPPVYPFPETLLGYGVFRHSLGDCADPVRLNEDPLDYATGFEIMDDPPAPGTPSIYAVHYIDRSGDALFDQAVGFASVSCEGAPVFRGTLDADHYNVGATTTACAGECWQPPWIATRQIVAVAAHFGIDLDRYVGTGQVVVLYGEVAEHWEMGLHYLVTDVAESGCGAVPAEGCSWSSLKAMYR